MFLNVSANECAMAHPLDPRLQVLLTETIKRTDTIGKILPSAGPSFNCTLLSLHRRIQQGGRGGVSKMSALSGKDYQLLTHAVTRIRRSAEVRPSRCQRDGVQVD